MAVWYPLKTLVSLVFDFLIVVYDLLRGECSECFCSGTNLSVQLVFFSCMIRRVNKGQRPSMWPFCVQLLVNRFFKKGQLRTGH